MSKVLIELINLSTDNPSNKETILNKAGANISRFNQKIRFMQEEI